jgi:DNA-binding phage protein
MIMQNIMTGFLDIHALQARAKAIGLEIYELADLAGVSRAAVYRAVKHETNMGIHRVIRLNAALTRREEEIRQHLQQLEAKQTQMTESNDGEQ